jgi:hypothetical protein
MPDDVLCLECGIRNGHSARCTLRGGFQGASGVAPRAQGFQGATDPLARAAMQAAAAEARSDERRLVVNYLHSVGARQMALEITAMKHHEDIDPS